MDAKTKELIALALSVGKECDGCIAAHAHGAAGKGATLEEVAETIGVAILMNGGPATVYGPRAFAAFQEFHDRRAEQLAGTAEPAHTHGTRPLSRNRSGLREVPNLPREIRSGDGPQGEGVVDHD